jgi:hypothetical protein
MEISSLPQISFIMVTGALYCQAIKNVKQNRWQILQENKIKASEAVIYCKVTGVSEMLIFL